MVLQENSSSKHQALLFRSIWLLALAPSYRASDCHLSVGLKLLSTLFLRDRVIIFNVLCISILELPKLRHPDLCIVYIIGVSFPAMSAMPPAKSSTLVDGCNNEATSFELSTFLNSDCTKSHVLNHSRVDEVVRAEVDSLVRHAETILTKLHELGNLPRSIIIKISSSDFWYSGFGSQSLGLLGLPYTIWSASNKARLSSSMELKLIAYNFFSLFMRAYIQGVQTGFHARFAKFFNSSSLITWKHPEGHGFKIQPSNFIAARTILSVSDISYMEGFVVSTSYLFSSSFASFTNKWTFE